MSAQPEPAFLSEDTREGMRAALTIVPSFIAIFVGFGIAAQAAGVPVWAAFGLTLAVYAAPAQFAIIELAGLGPAAVAQMIFAGILINLRFLLMSLTLAQLFPRVRRGALLLSAQFIAASPYLLTFFRSRQAPRSDLYRFYRGLIAIAVPAALLGTVLGLALGADLPQVVTFGATLFLPVYFSLLLASQLKLRREIAAAAAGLVLTPPAELLLPGWGMLFTALGVGAVLTLVKR